MSSNSAIEQASCVIDKQLLFKYWEIFLKDNVFNSYIDHVVKDVAMLLSTDDRLFSTTSSILPMYYPPPEDSSDTVKKVVEVFKKLKLPFLDESVVLVHVNCPQLKEDAKSVLNNIIQVHNKTPLTDLLKNKEIDIIIDYIAENLSREDGLIVSSLPLFEDVTGIYRSIQDYDEVFIWPGIPQTGYSSWIAGYNTIFLRHHGHWTCLDLKEELSVKTISKVQLYNQFIFQHPHFGLMDETCRYEHLKYIRDVLFSTVEYQKDRKCKGKSEDVKRTIREAEAFYYKLHTLECIGDTNAALLTVGSFCDHTKSIFCAFPEDFLILPEILKSEDWLVFFRKLGLKHMLKSGEFIKLCKKTANRGVRSVREASEELLKYLGESMHRTFGKSMAFLTLGNSMPYYDDRTLGQISNIPFVCAEKPTKVDWVLPGVAQVNQLVTLNGSALLRFQYQLWTIRPLIVLPKELDDTDVAKKLGVVTQPCPSDIITNIQNISRSCYSDDQLFINYPRSIIPCSQEDYTVRSLLKILEYNFECLSNCSSDLSLLTALPCIPVHVDLNNRDNSKMALVRPSCVIKSKKSESYHPFLHQLPIGLGKVFDILENTGVCYDVELSHIQIVLEKAFKNSENDRLLANTKKAVKVSITEMKEQLRLSKYAKAPSKTADVLTPLYLPDVEHRLRISSSLLYGDCSSYLGHMKLNLQDTPYYHFDILKEDYGISAMDLCRLLPHGVRPLGLSAHCKLVTDKNCSIMESSRLALMLQNSFQDESNPVNLVRVICRLGHEQSKEDEIRENIKTILNSMKVTTVENLRAIIIEKESGKEIGQVNRKYVFDYSECHLYLDVKADRDSDFSLEIAEHILKSVSQHLDAPLDPEEEKSIILFFGRYLKSKPEKKLDLLDEFRIQGCIDCDSEIPDLSKPGVLIPVSLHGRLDMHPDNIYNPQEIVGYERYDDEIITAKIIYLIEPDEKQSVYHRRYKIFISGSDETSIEVSILRLYKFLDGKKKPHVAPTGAQDNSGALVPHDGGDEVTNLRASLHTLSASETKKLICEQLKEIWKLPADLKKRAIRRLYLKYHPDKNLDNPDEAEALFLFLRAQIAHLEKGEPLDDPEADYNSKNSASEEQTFQSNSWMPDFTMWDHSANTYKRSRNRARRHQNSQPPFTQERVDRKNPLEGRRWIKQAEIDAEVLQVFLDQAQCANGYAHVCFLAHQVAEKALKGGMYARCGLDDRDIENHHLSDNAHALRTVEPVAACHLYKHCRPLETHYKQTRYPSEWPGYRDVPSDHYRREDAEEAKDHAEEVLRIVKSIMPHQTEE